MNRSNTAGFDGSLISPDKRHYKQSYEVSASRILGQNTQLGSDNKLIKFGVQSSHRHDEFSVANMSAQVMLDQ